jgi:acyl carrier protein
LGEVQAALAQHPAVAQAVVVVRDVEPGGRQLVAYVVWARQPAPSSRELRDFVRAYLPEYMVPQAFVSLPTLPLTINGKIDRRALPPPALERPEAADDEATPRTPLEATLAALWAKELRLDRVGVHDDFFELGGHSLLATHVLLRIRAALQVELPLSIIFEAPTVSGLAEAIEAHHLRPVDASST